MKGLFCEWAVSPVKRALHTMRATIEDVGADLRCFGVPSAGSGQALWPKQFLNSADIIACCRQMGGKAVTQGVGV